MTLENKELQLEFEQFARGKHPTLEFRPQQKEVILDILEAYFEDPNGIYLLDAPTGSGKSIIAILVADFLIYKSKRGYILASDLSLHQQYVTDFRKMQLWNWGNIKGVNNYTCAVNGEKFSVGDCKSKGLSYDAAESLPCFKHCGYLTSRRKAIRSPLALLTYPYALIQRNYVAAKSDKVPFPKRDFVVCDEAHKVLDIVQSHFSPLVSHDIYKKSEKLLDALFEIGLKAPKIDTLRLKHLIEYIYSEEDHSILLGYLKEVTKILKELTEAVGDIRELAGKEFIDEPVTRDWVIAFNLTDYCSDVYCKLEDYCDIISKTGLDKMVKNPGDKHIAFNCIDEYYLLNKHFFNQFGFKLMMTATLGKPADFMLNHGITNAKYFKMDSHFKWDKSPIIYYPGKKMSARFLANNLEWGTTKLADILKLHPKSSGIIHTASYEFGEKLWAGLPKMLQKRVILYKGSDEKAVALKKMKKRKGAVVMGPSLLEGLNLIDDLSRFQVFMKVPYPYLGDKYVAAKLKYSQKWYNWKTAVAVLQGSGRSIRTADDWAVTYLVDGCFGDLFQSAGDQFPIEFRSRVKIERTIVNISK